MKCRRMLGTSNWTNQYCCAANGRELQANHQQGAVILFKRHTGLPNIHDSTAGTILLFLASQGTRLYVRAAHSDRAAYLKPYRMKNRPYSTC